MLVREQGDLALLKEAAKKAGEIALRYWRQDPDVTIKADGGPVSEADLAVDAYLRETLCASRPDYGWLSEETEDNDARLRCNQVFIVDPIDGTRAYIDGQQTWAVSLAVVTGGVPTSAVVYLPARDKLYAAEIGGGATLNDFTISAASSNSIDSATVLASQQTLNPKHWLGPPPSFTRKMRPSLAYRLCLVAEGRFDAMLTFRKTWEWDIAGGVLIAAEAGARVTDRHGAPLQFNERTAQSDGAIVASPEVHTQVIHRLQRSVLP